MKKVAFILICCINAQLLVAQEKQHQIVFDFTKGDTASFSTMVRQARNIMLNSINAKVEIVCHGPGIDLLVKDKTTVQNEIQELTNKYQVVFAVCEATMKRVGIDRSRLLSQATIVPVANLEISTRQQNGWTYIKAGY